MNQAPPTEKQTGKQIVSKGEYALVQGKKGFELAISMSFWFIALCLMFVTLCCLFYAGKEAFGSDKEAEFFIITDLAVAVCALAGALFFIMIAKQSTKNALAIDPGVPLTRANTADLPTPDSLVRASAEPVQEPQSVLLRAATESVERYEEQLVRASVGGTE